MNATPETFKPGEQWLCAFDRYGSIQIREVECLRWSESYTYAKVRYFFWDSESGKRLAEVSWISEMPELLERLPDVESGNNQTGQASGVEATAGVVAYSHGKLILSLPPAFCEEVEVLLENWRKEQFAKIEPGRAFSVIPPEAETKA